jgi:hypothetical protein
MCQRWIKRTALPLPRQPLSIVNEGGPAGRSCVKLGPTASPPGRTHQGWRSASFGDDVRDAVRASNSSPTREEAEAAPRTNHAPRQQFRLLSDVTVFPIWNIFSGVAVHRKVIRVLATVIALALALGVFAAGLGCSGDTEDGAEPAVRTTAEVTTLETAPPATTVLVAPPAQEPLEVVTGEQSWAASGLEGFAECSPVEPGVALALLRWRPARERGIAQRIAVAILPGGFKTGDFRLSDPLGREASALEWRDIEGQAIHFWRVLTLQPKGWIASVTASFNGPICVVDEGVP